MSVRRSARRVALFAAVPLALLGSGAFVWQASYSAFTATTSTGSNTWTTATVALAADQSSTVVFSPAAIKPDSSRSALSPGNTGGAYAAASAASGGSACIKVTYTGTADSNVRLKATIGGADSATLGGQILFTVDMVNGNGADGANLSCSTFPTGSTYIYGASGTTTSFLKDFPSTYVGAAATQWSSVSNGGVKWYRLSWLLPSTVHETSTSTKNVTATFTWEANST